MAYPVGRRERLQLVSIATHEHRLRQQSVSGLKLDATVGTDCRDGSDQVLVGSHSTSHAVENYADTPLCHAAPLRLWV